MKTYQGASISWLISRGIYYLIGAWIGGHIGWTIYNSLVGWSFAIYQYDKWYAFGQVLLSFPLLGLIICPICGILEASKPQKELEEKAKIQRAEAEKQAAIDEAKRPPERLKLQIGTSSGWLKKRGHSRGVGGGLPVNLMTEDCCKNILILGGIGSGKTTRAINPLLHQILSQDTGALIFDVKGDFMREAGFISRQTGRSMTVVGDGGLTLNLIRGCTPEVAASYLKSCFLSNGGASGDSMYFIDNAVELCRNSLTLLDLAGADYSLASLYDIVFDESLRETMLQECASKMDSMSDRELRFLKATTGYFSNIWGRLEEKQKSPIISTVAQVLSPFSHPDLVDAFSAGEQGEVDLAGLINNAEIYFVNLPMSKFGKEGARYAYLLIKLRFFSLMRERRTRPDWNQQRTVAFLCDEYQAIIDPVSDTDFWDKSRSSGCVGIVSMQGISSMIHALNNQQATNAILQNFRQRIIFRTEDDATISLVQKLLGQIDVHMIGYSAGTNTTPQLVGSGTGARWIDVTSASDGQSESLQRQNLFDQNDFRQLDSKAVFLGNIGQRAVDEVLNLKPYYVE